MTGYLTDEEPGAQRALVRDGFGWTEGGRTRVELPAGRGGRAFAAMRRALAAVLRRWREGRRSPAASRRITVRVLTEGGPSTSGEAESVDLIVPPDVRVRVHRRTARCEGVAAAR